MNLLGKIRNCTKTQFFPRSLLLNNRSKNQCKTYSLPIQKTQTPQSNEPKKNQEALKDHCPVFHNQFVIQYTNLLGQKNDSNKIQFF